MKKKNKLNNNNKIRKRKIKVITVIIIDFKKEKLLLILILRYLNKSEHTISTVWYWKRRNRANIRKKNIFTPISAWGADV